MYHFCGILSKQKPNIYLITNNAGIFAEEQNQYSRKETKIQTDLSLDTVKNHIQYNV